MWMVVFLSLSVLMVLSEVIISLVLVCVELLFMMLMLYCMNWWQWFFCGCLVCYIGLIWIEWNIEGSWLWLLVQNWVSGMVRLQWSLRFERVVGLLVVVLIVLVLRLWCRMLQESFLLFLLILVCRWLQFLMIGVLILLNLCVRQWLWMMESMCLWWVLLVGRMLCMLCGGFMVVMVLFFQVC